MTTIMVRIKWAFECLISTDYYWRSELGKAWLGFRTVITVLFCTLMVVGDVFAQDASYKRVSRRVYDAARVVEPKVFTVPALLKEFRDFVTLECGERKLARLTLAPSQEDLGQVTNVRFILDGWTSAEAARFVSSHPAILGQNVDRLRTAQVLCNGGNATAMIRNGNEVERHQISGSSDSRDWSVGSTALHLVGFSLHSAGLEWISAFVRTMALPNLNAAAAIRDDIELRTGVPTYLILRTDPFFWDMEGPKFDAFEVPTPRISAKEFLSRPYISCPPSNNRKPCLLETSH